MNGNEESISFCQKKLGENLSNLYYTHASMVRLVVSYHQVLCSHSNIMDVDVTNYISIKSKFNF